MMRNLEKQFRTDAWRFIALSAALLLTFLKVLPVQAKSADPMPIEEPARIVQILEIAEEPREEPESPAAECSASLLYGAREIGSFSVSYYDTCVLCCGKDDGITASGSFAAPYETCAADPSVIPLGSEILVDYGNGDISRYRAEDTGVLGNCIDICVSDHQEALGLGRKMATVYIIEEAAWAVEGGIPEL